MKKIIVIMVLFVILLNSCMVQEQKELSNVKVRLKWLHQAQFAGNYVAKEKGFYEEQGLNIELLEGGVDYPSIEDVVSGNSDYGIAGADDLTVAVVQGKPVKAIAVIYKYSPVCYFSLDENIKTPYDFVGKKVGIKQGTGTTHSYVSMLNYLEINRSSITEIPVQYDLNMLYNGEVDIWPGFRINEPQQAIDAGYEVYEIYPEDWGVSTYADVLFTTLEKIENNPEEVRGFVQATLQGWHYAIENEEEAVDIVMNYAQDSRDHQEFMLLNSIPLIRTGDSKLGVMDKKVWENQVNLLLENNIIDSKIDTNMLFTNDFVE